MDFPFFLLQPGCGQKLWTWTAQTQSPGPAAQWGSSRPPSRHRSRPRGTPKSCPGPNAAQPGGTGMSPRWGMKFITGKSSPGLVTPHWQPLGCTSWSSMGRNPGRWRGIGTGPPWSLTFWGKTPSILSSFPLSCHREAFLSVLRLLQPNWAANCSLLAL